MYRFSSPLQIFVGKRKFILNLNNYRNTHYRVLNNAKVTYKMYMKKQIEKLPRLQPPIQITYTVFKGDKRNCDIGNICSVHQKFFEDALVPSITLPSQSGLSRGQILMSAIMSTNCFAVSSSRTKDASRGRFSPGSARGHPDSMMLPLHNSHRRTRSCGSTS